MAQSPNPGAIFLTLAAASVFAGPLFPFVALTLPIWAQALSGPRRQDRRQPSSHARSGASRQQQQRGFGFSSPDDESQYEHRWALLLWAARCFSSLRMTCSLSGSLSCRKAGGAACCYSYDSSCSFPGLDPWPRQMPDILLWHMQVSIHTCTEAADAHAVPAAAEDGDAAAAAHDAADHVANEQAWRRVHGTFWHTRPIHVLIFRCCMILDPGTTKTLCSGLLSAHPFSTHLIIGNTSQPQGVASGCSFT